MTAVPFVGVVTDVIVSVAFSGSTSFARTLMLVSYVSNGVVTKSSFATGAVLVPNTWTLLLPVLLT